MKISEKALRRIIISEIIALNEFSTLDKIKKGVMRGEKMKMKGTLDVKNIVDKVKVPFSPGDITKAYNAVKTGNASAEQSSIISNLFMNFLASGPQEKNQLLPIFKKVTAAPEGTATKSTKGTSDDSEDKDTKSGTKGGTKGGKKLSDLFDFLL